VIVGRKCGKELVGVNYRRRQKKEGEDDEKVFHLH